MTMTAPPLDASPPVTPRRRTISIRSRGQVGELAGLDFGDPERPIDVVFLHANGFNAMTYRSVLAPLGRSLRILAVDQQGHGRSPRRSPIEGRPDWQDLKDDLLALLDALDGPPLVLAGHSMGGAVSVLAAGERPDRVKALALFDPVIVSKEMRARAAESATDNLMAAGAVRRRAEFPDREAVFASYRGRGAFRTWPDEALADYLLDGLVERADGTVELACTPAWEASGYRAANNDTWSAMLNIFAPVRVLRAEFVSTCHLETADAFNPGNRDVQVRTIPGSTHFLPIERPDLVRETLLETAGL